MDVGKLLFNHSEPESFTLVSEHWDSEVVTAMTMNSGIATRTMTKTYGSSYGLIFGQLSLLF